MGLSAAERTAVNLLANLRSSLGKQSDLLLVAAVVGILLVLFTPIPTVVLDLLLILNVSFTLIILLLTFYVERPLQFSTFPSLLLLATLFRLSLNVAATRLILNTGNAGKVIQAVGEHVVGGNYVVGLVVFIVLIVVQYVVVTNGAQRVAEVAARFTLDSMPGKQMSIDADMNIGIIDEKEAQRRRREIEKEGSFYGAMDGASKFVKGDAIAGIIIILIDIIGGLTIGIAQKGLGWAEALHDYTLLTVGDGIVTQIPALIISTGTGIIVTRAASDEVLSKEISRQITSYPKTLLLVAAGLLLVIALPGIPVLPVLLVLAVVCALAWYGFQSKRAAASEAAQTVLTDEEDLYSQLHVEPVQLEVGSGLVGLASDADGFMERIVAFRKQHARDTGLVVPKVKLTDNTRLTANEYEISVYGARVGHGQIHPQRMLAITSGAAAKPLPGAIETREPAYGLPASWVDEEGGEEARKRGYTLVDAPTVLMTHLGEVFKRHAAELLSRKETEALIEQVRKRDKGLVEELIPNVLSMSDVQKVLQYLLREEVSIRNLDVILEVLVDRARATKDPAELVELVRQKLAPQICQSLAGASGDLYVLMLDPAVEKTLAQVYAQTPNAQAAPLEPRFADQMLKRLAGSVEKMMSANVAPVLLCGAELRKGLKEFTMRTLPHLKILSMHEVGTNIRLKSFGVVTV
jgi:flagellar biosynthesis protein FlhA